MRVFRRSILALAVSTAVTANAALARPSMQQLEQVVVTAQKREQIISDVPISITAVSGEIITERGIQNLEELSEQIPNLKMTESPSQKTIFIRGQGNGGADAGLEQSVGLFIDGIYGGRDRQFASPFLDIQRVEVMRGPQTTFFGKNTTAGALAIHTARPTEEFEAFLIASYEPELEETAATGVVSGPLTDTLMGRLAATWRENEAGWLEDPLTGEESVLSETGAIAHCCGAPPTGSRYT